jgi:DNA-binding response OmpR family regulator
MDGWEVCRTLRKYKVKTPILMLTALDDVEDKIRGLDYGADDYMTKPFNFGELIARIRSLVRRNSDEKTTVIKYSNLEMNTANRTVQQRQNFYLSAKEFAMLEYFLLNKNRVLTREMISEHVWDMNFDPQSNVIDSFIRYLRQKIDQDFDPPRIHTIRGVGYKLSDSY